ncbi:MAG: two-component sensor histidine kinase, partial [Caulobacter sp.]|nr:two-component sensor histidine kinase [Vitreoscilla sp.]
VAPALALVIGWLVSRSLAPLQRLAVEVRARDSGSLQALPVTGLPDEVLPLVQSLHALLDRLGSALAAQRHFVGDPARELRSPRTALNLQVQVMRRAPDEAARDEAARALTAGVDRATRLVEQLLALARSEATPPREAHAAPLAGIVRMAMGDVAPLAEARGTTLELDVGDDAETATVSGDADVAVLARNLIDNAVRYSPHGGHVSVWVGLDEARASAPVLQVDDDGPGIPEGEREMVFDRFVRRDNAADQTGSGLGLAIVRQVALRQGAEVVLETSPTGGLRVRVAWPAPTPS